MNELADQLALLDKGEPVDLDGDGHPEALEVRHADGSSVYTSDRDGDGAPEYLRQDDGKGHVLTTIDADGDGLSEQITEITVSQDEQKRVVTRDGDGNGTMDQRSTWVVARETPDFATFTEEVDEDEDGTFTVVRSEQVSTSWNSGGGCDGTANFPSGASLPLVRGSVDIVVGGAAGACKQDQVPMVREAFECAVEKGRSCLADTNSKNFNDLSNALRGKGVTSLDIACGNGCAGVVASAKSFSRPWLMNSRLNINPGEFGKLDAEGRCNIMLHELMHWAGNHGSSELCGGILESDCTGDQLRNSATCCSTCPSGCDSSNDIPCSSGGQNAESDTCTPTNPPHCGR